MIIYRLSDLVFEEYLYESAAFTAFEIVGGTIALSCVNFSIGVVVFYILTLSSNIVKN